MELAHNIFPRGQRLRIGRQRPTARLCWGGIECRSALVVEESIDLRACIDCPFKAPEPCGLLGGCSGDADLNEQWFPRVPPDKAAQRLLRISPPSSSVVDEVLQDHIDGGQRWRELPIMKRISRGPYPCHVVCPDSMED